MTCRVRVLRASRCAVTGITLWSFELRYWRAIHAELMTHRVFSRNAGSSRAVPVAKMLKQVWNDPAGPIHWGQNQAGMQAAGELQGWRRAAAKAVWKWAGRTMCVAAWVGMKLGLHKQVANRLLEPWQYINVVVSSTDWENFFALRAHPAAQPEFQELALEMQAKMRFSYVRLIFPGEWHLIYILPEERDTLPIETLLKLSTARAARVSYEPFDGNASIEKELERHDMLVGSDPIHASPTEHQAMCVGRHEKFGNFRGFRQYRQVVEDRARARATA